MFDWLRKLFRRESKPATPRATEAPAPGVIVVSPFVPAASSISGPAATPPPIPRVSKLNLDAADFLPIAREELLEAGRQQGRSWFGNVWFGRRDLIPPPDDPRTKLVDRGLGQRDSDTARLQAAGLPVLCTPADVAAGLGLTIPQLRWLAFHAEVATRIHYVHFTVPKKSGGLRTLSAPHRKLAAAQRWIHDNILSKVQAEPAAQGFQKGSSTVSNARPHCRQAVVVNMDLENFFPTIVFARVRSVFHRLGYSPCVASILALLCTECPRRQVSYDGKSYWVATGPRGLPQGACTSPALSNQVARRLDKRLGGLAKKLNLAYTRYADDLTFSGSTELEPRLGYLLARVRHLAEAEGFAVNAQKTRVLRRATAQTVTGLIVNDKPAVPRRERRRLRALLHRARREGLDQQNRDGRPNFRAYLEGKIAYVRMVQPAVGTRLLEEYKALP